MKQKKEFSQEPLAAMEGITIAVIFMMVVIILGLIGWYFRTRG